MRIAAGSRPHCAGLRVLWQSVTVRGAAAASWHSRSASRVTHCGSGKRRRGAHRAERQHMAHRGGVWRHVCTAADVHMHRRGLQELPPERLHACLRLDALCGGSQHHLHEEHTERACHSIVRICSTRLS
jgi:hypothetical protein